MSDWCNFRNYECPHDCVWWGSYPPPPQCLCVMYCLDIVICMNKCRAWKSVTLNLRTMKIFLDMVEYLFFLDKTSLRFLKIMEGQNLQNYNLISGGSEFLACNMQCVDSSSDWARATSPGSHSDALWSPALLCSHPGLSYTRGLDMIGRDPSLSEIWWDQWVRWQWHEIWEWGVIMRSS